MSKGKKHILKNSQIATFRLKRHYLIDRHQADLTTVCQDVCGIQAQVMSAAEMAFGSRMHDLTRADIHSALWANRTLVKTSCMRQTLHLIPAADFSIYINAFKKRRVQALMRIMSKFDITQKEVDRLNEVVLESLGDGPMTQPELLEKIISGVGKKMRTYMDRVWSIQIFRPALVEGLICYGPVHGKKATFVRVDQWLPEQKEIDETESQKILLRRYLGAFGPAKPQDFSRWTGNSMQEVRMVWESMKTEMVEVRVEDKKAWILKKDCDQLNNNDLNESILRLLPHFDSFMLGHVNKAHLLDSSHYKRVYRNQGWISPVVLLNGKVIGTWSSRRQGKQLLLGIEPFEKFTTRICTMIESEAAHLAKFLVTSWEIKFRK